MSFDNMEHLYTFTLQLHNYGMYSKKKKTLGSPRAAGIAASCPFSPLRSVCFSAAIHNNAFIMDWIVASSPSAQFLNEEKQRIPELKIIHCRTQECFLLTVLSGPFVSGISSLHLLLWVLSLWSMFVSRQTHQILSSHPFQSSLRAPSLRGPLTALRSARLASSSFLLSSRFFLESSALLRPG